MSSDLQRLDELEKRVKRLESRESYIRQLIRSPNDPLARLALNDDLTSEDMIGLEGAMEKFHQKLEGGEKPTQTEFEQALSPYRPRGENEYEFAKSVLMGFKQFHVVVNYFRPNFNVPDFSARS